MMKDVPRAVARAVTRTVPGAMMGAGHCSPRDSGWGGERWGAPEVARMDE